MARARTIKPGFFSNEELAEVPPLGRLLFAGLWTIADRAGRLEDRPKKIKAALLPYDDCDGEALIADLAARGFLRRYVAGDGRYIQIVTFARHQNPHKNEAESVIAPEMEVPISYVGGVVPEEQGASTVQAPEEHSTNRARTQSPRTREGEPSVPADEPPTQASHDDMAPAEPIAQPAPSKPRTARQQASDRLFDRRTALFGAYCRGIGVGEGTFPANQRRDRAFREMGPVVAEVEVTPAVLESLTRYAVAAYRWRDGKKLPSVAEVLAAFPEWDQAGRPPSPPPRETARVKDDHPNAGGRGRWVG